MRLLLALFTLCLTGANCQEVEFRFQKERLPDGVFSFEPYLWNEGTEGVTGAFQIGPQIGRGYLAYGRVLPEEVLLKAEGEYLVQKLGFDFSSGRSHKWAAQAAFCGSGKWATSWKWVEELESGLVYSHSFDRKLPDKSVTNRDLISQRRIAGSNAVSYFLNGFMNIRYLGRMRVKLLYDWVRYSHPCTSPRQTLGVGAGLEFTQNFGRWGETTLGAEWRNPYTEYYAKWLIPYLAWGRYASTSLFAQKVIGNHHLPSSSRIGIEIGFQFGNGKVSQGSDSACDNLPTRLQGFLSDRTWIRPQVLAKAGETHVPYCSSQPHVTNPIGTLTLANGPFNLNLKAYFGGDDPLVFTTSPLPPGLSIDPWSGTISGTVSALAPQSYPVTAKATNSCGAAQQTFTLLYLGG